METRLIYTELELVEWMSLFDYVCQRKQVGESNGIKFIIHTSEEGHNMPHLHASYQDKEVVLEIPTGNVIAGNLDSRKLKKASNWVLEHQDYLKDKWDELTNGICCFG